MKGTTSVLFCIGAVLTGAATAWTADVQVVEPITIEHDGAAVEVVQDQTVVAQDEAAAEPSTSGATTQYVEFEEKTQVAAAPAEVWWGNRAVSFRNYIPIERIATAYVAPEPVDLRWDKIFFDLDKSFIRPDALPELEKIRMWMQANPGESVVVEGHTCDWASDNYNAALGLRRAESVKRWLVEHGIAPTRIETTSYGEQQPWVDNNGTRPLNRRAIVVVDGMH